MPKFSPGDPVWARCDGVRFPLGEYAAVVIESSPAAQFLTEFTKKQFYTVDIQNCPPPPGRFGWTISEGFLRPRRDDYQQHEGLGSRDKLTNPLADEVVAKELLDAIGSTLAGV